MKNIFTYKLIPLLILFTLLVLPFTVGQAGDQKLNSVIIDAGHGGKDPGTTGLSGIYEKMVVLSIVQKISKYLTAEYSDLKVTLTRDKDEFIELKNRGKIANSSEGDLFVSIHCNARKTDENDKYGFEIYVMDIARNNEALSITSQENKLLEGLVKSKDEGLLIYLMANVLQNSYMKMSERFSLILQSEMVKGTKLESRGVFQAGFYVLLGASMPTVLVECGYLSNKKDEEYLKSDKGQDDIAKSVYKAIRLFKFDFENK